MTRVSIDQDRLWADVMALADITDPARPWTRRSFSPLFAEGRRWLTRRMEAAGLAMRTDTAGNLIGRRAGRVADAKALVIGSHIDTVPGGGRFDGIAGVAAGLEVVRALADAGVALDHPIEVIDFLAEEPSEFGLSCVGSRGMAGALTAEQLAQRGPGHETLADAIDRMGGDVGRLAEAKRADIAAALELHIEQGPVLEAGPAEIGLVGAIVGITRVEIELTGAAAHAGTAPMTRRRDAAVAGAAIVGFVSDEAKALAAAGTGYFVATTGIFEVAPGGANVVPGRARLVVDARSEARATMERFLPALRAAAERAAAASDVALTRFSLLSDTHPAPCDTGLLRVLADGAAALGLATTAMASGAGHDTAFLTRIAPAAMIFVACRDGLSHCPEEWAEPDALAKGAAVLAEAVRRLDRT